MRYNIKDINHVYAEFANVICKINPSLTIPPMSLIVKLLNGNFSVIGHYCSVLGIGEGGLNCIINNINPQYYNTVKILSTTVGLREKFSKLFGVTICPLDGKAFEVYYNEKPILVIDEENDLLYIDKASLNNYYVTKDMKIVGESKGIMSITENEIPDITSIVKSYLKNRIEINYSEGYYEYNIQEPISLNGKNFILSIFTSYSIERLDDGTPDAYVDSVDVTVYDEEGNSAIKGDIFRLVDEETLKEYVKKTAENTI